MWKDRLLAGVCAKPVGNATNEGIHLMIVLEKGLEVKVAEHVLRGWNHKRYPV